MKSQKSKSKNPVGFFSIYVVSLQRENQFLRLIYIMLQSRTLISDSSVIIPTHPRNVMKNGIKYNWDERHVFGGCIVLRVRLEV
jgi:hypothetical protein